MKPKRRLVWRCRNPGLLVVPLAAGCAGPAEPGVVDPREVLLLLYEQADGPNWKRSDNWGTDAPLDEWFGVETDAQGNVTELILPANGLAGTVPPELGNLGRLELMDLSDNELTGCLPPTLQSIPYHSPGENCTP